MTIIKIIKRATTVSALTSIGALGLYAQNITQDVSEDALIVTASRLAESEDGTISKVDHISAEDREQRQEFRFQDALGLTSGVIATSTAGQEGQIGSLIMRGLPTRYNQIHVDGVRISDSVDSGTYGNLLGNLTLGHGEQLEVVNGAQAVVHGSAALGGLVGIYNTFSEEAPGLSVTQEIGSYEYTRSQLSSSGKIEDFSYYFNASHGYFEQDLSAASAYQVTNSQLSLGVQYELNDTSALRFTARGGQSDLENAGTIIGNDYELFSAQLLTDSNEGYQSSLVVGYFNQDYHYGSSFSTNYEKVSMTSDHKVQFSEDLSLNLGLDVSVNDYDSDSAFSGVKKTSWETVGFYIDGLYNVGAVELSAGARAEYHSDFNFIPSSHLGAKLHVDEYDAAVYTRFSTGFRAPSLLESEAYPAASFSAEQFANGGLDQEEYAAVELGVEKTFLDKHSVNAAFYTQFLSSAIARTPYSTGIQFQNQEGTSEVFGGELTVKGEVLNGVNYQLAWNHSFRNEVNEIPRNTVAADINYATERWLVGVGMSHRTKADFGLGIDLDSYVTTRVYGQYHINDYVTVSGRVENALDEQYELEPFSKTPGKGASAYLGLTLNW